MATPNNIERPSLNTTLAQRYADAATLSPAAGNAKKAGLPSPATTDYVASGDGEFRSQQGPAGIRNDTRSVQVAKWNAQGGQNSLKTVAYSPSGRK